MQPLAHAARIRLDPLALAAGQPDEVEQLGDAPALLAHRHAVQVGEIAEVVERGEPVVEASVAAEDVADAAPDFARVLRRVVAEHPGAASGRQEQRRQDLDRGRLAGAVRAEQAEQLAFRNLERNAADSLDLDRPAAENSCRGPVGAAEVADLDDRGHSAFSGPW